MRPAFRIRPPRHRLPRRAALSAAAAATALLAATLTSLTFAAVPANISEVTGTHTVYLEFSSGASGSPPFVSVHYFNFPTS